ncbi:para-nitrobenzyl esterase [Byssothecium circinans]|uniref:Carboxylic ester hydrolase n=1 Tax=Byssothecium circinans TaxID=147558 RepID=A0A6A5TCK4_9PLEO|nr:para-nitrobenzyl esterase [Byssothecium circinans]
MATLKTALGEFTGKAGDEIIQYLGIKYASVKDQLSNPELVTSYETQVIDASSFGPQAPAMNSCEFEQIVLIQQHLGVPVSPPMSGTECLNLNITVPKIDTSTAGNEKLPVMVFIHGGGFIMGSNYWPHYDPSQLVKFSVELGMPVIAVNINYRLGILGNLTSSRLREAGYSGNNSLRDQKCALHWIKAHISHFGGDPENVTLFGESAGAAAALYQLFSKEALFKRVISMSGTPIMLKPVPPSVAETSYDMIMRALGLENASVEERIKHLTTISPEELVAKTPMSVPLKPFVDGDIVPTTISFKMLAEGERELDDVMHGREWCEELMIGDCQHDGTVYFFMGLAERKAGIASTIYISLAKNMGAASAQAVLEAYNIMSTTSDDEAMKAILELANDLAYYAPAVKFAKSFPGKSYYYHFNELNPWDGAFNGCATHLLDAAFLFQNFSDMLDGRQRKVGRDMGEAFLRFVNGIKPWKILKGQDVYDGVKAFGVGDAKLGASGRRDVLFKLEQEGKIELDALSMAWDMFVAGK